MDCVCYFEVFYDDKECMESFYFKVFGWNFMFVLGDVFYIFVMIIDVDEIFMLI